MTDTRSVTLAGHRYSWRQVGAALFLVLGAALIATGWIGVSQNNEVWQQMPYFVSGGVGGLALVLVGLGLYNAHQHAVDQAQVGELCRRLQALELGLGGEFDDVLARLDDLAVGRARVRLDLGNGVGAASDAALVDPGFQFFATRSVDAATRYNDAWYAMAELGNSSVDPGGEIADASMPMQLAWPEASARATLAPAT